LSIDGSQSRFRRHAVVAHICSLQILPHNAMPLLGRKTISSQLPFPELLPIHFAREATESSVVPFTPFHV
jgi:hypothetical protein